MSAVMGDKKVAVGHEDIGHEEFGSTNGHRLSTSSAGASLEAAGLDGRSPVRSASGESCTALPPEMEVHVRPLSVKASRPAVSEEFDFWSKPGKKAEQLSDSQPVSSPKLWQSRSSVSRQEQQPADQTAGRFSYGVQESYEMFEGSLGNIAEYVGATEVGEFAEDCLGQVLEDDKADVLDRREDTAGEGRFPEVARIARRDLEVTAVLQEQRGSSSAFATNPACSSSSTVDSSGFSIHGVTRAAEGHAPRKPGGSLGVVSEEQDVAPLGVEDSASVSGSRASPAVTPGRNSLSREPSKSLDIPVKASSEEVNSKSGSRASQDQASPSRPLYTDTPAMVNDVSFGISTFGKLGRSRSFATGSIKGAIVHTPEDRHQGHRRAHSELRKVTFQLEAAPEGKRSSGELSPSSLRPSKNVEDLRAEARKKLDWGTAAEKSGFASEPSASSQRGRGASAEVFEERAPAGDEISRKGSEDRQLAVVEVGSPKVIDRSALFKKWLEKNKEETASSGPTEDPRPVPMLQRIGSSNDVLPPPLSWRSPDRSLKRTISHSAVPISPPSYRMSGEIQSLEGAFESPLPSPRRKSQSTPSSPVGGTAGKHTRQLSLGASKPPKAPKSPPSFNLPPKHPHSPTSKPWSPRLEKSASSIAALSLGPAVIDAAVDLGPSTSGASPQFISRNLGRLPQPRIPSPKTNSVLRKAMSSSKAEAPIHVGAELVDAGLPADAKDAIPQLIARIIKATSRSSPPSKQPASSLTAPKLSQVAPLPQKGVKNNSTESLSVQHMSPEGSDDVTSTSEEGSFAASLMSLSPRALLRSTSLPSYIQSVLPSSFLNTFSAQVSLTAPSEPNKLLTDAPHESPQVSLTPEQSIMLLGRLALAGEFEQEHGRALLAQARTAVIATLVEALKSGAQQEQEAAAGLTRVLTLLDEGRSALLEVDGLKLLVDLLCSGSPRTKVAAAGTLRNLAYKSTNQKHAIMAAGALGPLVSLLRSTTPGAPEAAASALRSLAMADGMEEIIVQNGAIQPLVRLLHSPQSPAAKEASAATLQNLATHDEHRRTIVDSGAIPALYKMLLAPEISSQMASAGALRNLAAGGSAFQSAIGESGAIGPLIKILGKRGPNVPPGMPEAAAGALANLSLLEANRAVIAEEGGVAALIEMVKSGGPNAQLVGMEALKNLATNTANIELIVKAGAIPVLVRNLGSLDRRLQRSAVRVLHNVGAEADHLATIKQGAFQVLEDIVNGRTGLEEDEFLLKLYLQLKRAVTETRDTH